MNFSNPLGAQFRTVAQGEREGQPTRRVEGSRVYSTDPSDLWDALTNPERLPRWFLPVSGELAVGGRYQLEGNASGEILQCDEPRTLEVTWEFGGSSSWVEVTLEPAEGGTRLTLLHTMPETSDATAEEHWDTYGPGATGVGWDQSFFAIGLHLENDGAAIDPATYFEWLATEAGKAFVTSCASGWAEAHSASGADAEVARAMGQRTAAFYRGESQE